MILTLLDENLLIKAATSGESKVFYYKFDAIDKAIASLEKGIFDFLVRFLVCATLCASGAGLLCLVVSKGIFLRNSFVWFKGWGVIRK